MSETCKCGGTGEIVIELATTTQPMADGGSVVSGGSSTSLCECRRRLPRRHGKVSWWTWADPVSWSFAAAGQWWLKATVTTKQEMPVSEDGYPLHRTLNNAHFNTGASIEIDGEALTSDDLREFAKFLTECADKIDAMDKPVSDEGSADVA